MTFDKLTVLRHDGAWKIEHAGNYSPAFATRIDAICQAHRLACLMIAKVSVVVMDDPATPRLLSG